MALTQIFIYLQLLDLLTTLVGFKLGASEASPFIRMLMHAGPVGGCSGLQASGRRIGRLCVSTRSASTWSGGPPIGMRRWSSGISS